MAITRRYLRRRVSFTPTTTTVTASTRTPTTFKRTRRTTVRRKLRSRVRFTSKSFRRAATTRRSPMRFRRRFRRFARPRRTQYKRRAKTLTRIARWNSAQTLQAIFQNMLTQHPDFNNHSFAAQLNTLIPYTIQAFTPQNTFESTDSTLKALAIYLQNGNYYPQFNPAVSAAFGFGYHFSVSARSTKAKANWKNFSMPDKVCFAFFYAQFAPDSKNKSFFEDNKDLIQSIPASLTKKIQSGINHIIKCTPNIVMQAVQSPAVDTVMVEQPAAAAAPAAEAAQVRPVAVEVQARGTKVTNRKKQAMDPSAASTLINN